MAQALFEGLVFDENDQPANVAFVGNEPTYIVVEDGFKYHVDARIVDEQVLQMFREQVENNKDSVSSGLMKMMGKDDLFTKASIDTSIRNMDRQIEQVFENGIPEQSRAYLGMLGFRIVINRHGDVVKLGMPSGPATDEEN